MFSANVTGFMPSSPLSLNSFLTQGLAPTANDLLLGEDRFVLSVDGPDRSGGSRSKGPKRRSPLFSPQGPGQVATQKPADLVDNEEPTAKHVSAARQGLPITSQTPSAGGTQAACVSTERVVLTGLEPVETEITSVRGKFISTMQSLVAIGNAVATGQAKDVTPQKLCEHLSSKPGGADILYGIIHLMYSGDFKEPAKNTLGLLDIETVQKMLADCPHDAVVLCHFFKEFGRPQDKVGYRAWDIELRKARMKGSFYDVDVMHKEFNALYSWAIVQESLLSIFIKGMLIKRPDTFGFIVLRAIIMQDETALSMIRGLAYQSDGYFEAARRGDVAKEQALALNLRAASVLKKLV
jgi:hypothetical protein